MQGGARNQPINRGIDKRHQRANECHHSRWEQCRVERWSRDIREKYSNRTHRSPSLGRFPPRVPYSSKYRSQLEVDFVTEQFCVQVGGARSKSAAGKLQANHPERHSHYSHQEAHKHGPQGANKSSRIAE